MLILLAAWRHLREALASVYLNINFVLVHITGKLQYEIASCLQFTLYTK